MISQKVFSNRVIPLLIQKAGAHRKPRWLPVAKSKIYRIPKRPEIPEEERLELRRLNNRYHTQMRAIKSFYYNEMMKEKLTTESASSEMSIRLEADEWQRCVELNDQWNKQVALEREKRREEEVQALEEYALGKMERNDRKMNLKLEKATEAIRREKEQAKNFITAETLEAAIDHALANPKDYNFAIDLNGNLYQGRDSPPTPPRVEKEAQASA